MVKRPSPPKDPKFLKITVQNTGTMPTTITNVTFHTYGSWWMRFRKTRPDFSAVLNDYEGPPYPRPLPVGGEWTALMTQDDRFTTLLSGGMPVYVAIHHSFAKVPTQVRVFQIS
jgi:hypothetical protein